MELSLDNIGEIDAMADAETPAALARTESGVRRIAPSAQLPLSSGSSHSSRVCPLRCRRRVSSTQFPLRPRQPRRPPRR